MALTLHQNKWLHILPLPQGLRLFQGCFALDAIVRGDEGDGEVSPTY